MPQEIPCLVFPSFSILSLTWRSEPAKHDELGFPGPTVTVAVWLGVCDRDSESQWPTLTESDPVPLPVILRLQWHRDHHGHGHGHGGTVHWQQWQACPGTGSEAQVEVFCVQGYYRESP
jgi:hypothetical protein